MPGVYGANGEQNLAVARISMLGLTASALTRAELESFECGADDAMSDNKYRLRGQKYTAAGASTAVTPDGTDDADPVAQLAVGSNHTVEPTYAGVPLIDVPVHLRATFVWQPREGYRVIIPATAANGFGFGIDHASLTNLVRGSMRWRE